MTLFHNIYCHSMYKKTVDKRAKRCYSRIYRTKYIKMLIRKALYAKGFQRIPQAALSGSRCERGIPEFSAHRL